MKTINPSVIIICLLMVYGCKPKDSSQEEFLRPTLGVVEDPPLDPRCSDKEDWTVSCMDHCNSLHDAKNDHKLYLRFAQVVEIQHTGGNTVKIKKKIGDDVCQDDN